MIEVRHLRYFVTVAEELHFGRAADRLHMAQSPLSHQIRQLEDRLGVVLLERNHHVIGLTDAGRTFLEEARTVLGALDEAVERTRRAARGEVGNLRIGYVPEAATELLPLSLRTHRSEHPEVELDLRPGPTGLLLDLVRSRELDVAFVRSPDRLDELEYDGLTQEPLLLALPVGHPAPAAPVRALSLADLSGEGFVVPSRLTGRGLRSEIDAACDAAGFRPGVIREAGSMSSLLLMVAAGSGIALVPASVANSRQVAGVDLVEIPGLPMTGSGLCWRRGETSQVVLRFIDTVHRAGTSEPMVRSTG